MLSASAYCKLDVKRGQELVADGQYVRCALCRFGSRADPCNAKTFSLFFFCNQLTDKIYAHKFVHSKEFLEGHYHPYSCLYTSTLSFSGTCWHRYENSLPVFGMSLHQIYQTNIILVPMMEL
jgi:hypothetical protein